MKIFLNNKTDYLKNEKFSYEGLRNYRLRISGNRFNFPILIASLFFLLTWTVRAQDFVHPGGLHTLEDLNRMKEKVAAGESPWIEGWNALVADWKSSATYGMTNGAMENANHRQSMNRDAQAAYLNALRWYISGDVAHAEKAISIYNAYASKVNQIPSGGYTDIVGLGGIGFTAMAVGAEIMRLYDGWAPEDFEKFKFMMKEYFYPATRDFLTNHRGACPTHYWANWDLNNISAQIAIGILVDDRDIFNEGIEYFKNGVGAGNIHNAVPFVQGNFGQWQESGRDQSHSMLGIGLMANICQLTWNQGVDLYGYDDNRFLKGAEYVARTGGLSLSAPFFEEYNSCSNRRNRWVSINGLGRYFDQPVWEAVYNHYVVKKGLEAPHVKAMAQVMRLSGSTNDQLGHGTLTYTLDGFQSPPAFSAPPGQLQGLIANEGIGWVQLRWNAPESMDVTGYVVKRATSPGGPYTIVKEWSRNTNPEYIDVEVENGTTYYYVVSANNQAGDGPDSEEIAATPSEGGTTMPTGWARTDIGDLQLEGEAIYSEVNTGNTFITSGAGFIGRNSDALGFTYGIASGDLTFTARITSFEGVQKTGIMIRESLAPDAKTVLIKIGDAGARVVDMGVRSGTGSSMEWIGGNRFTWLPEIWFRISRSGNTFTLYESNNKEVWYEVGSRTIEMAPDVYVGLFNTSGNTASWNTTRFDHVSVTGLAGNAPGVPANLVASPGNTQTLLDWDDLSGASSYSVKRSEVSGGPYEVVATNLSSSEYLDTELENGVIYYYVVAAENLSGGGGDSEEVSATPQLAIPPAPSQVLASTVSLQEVVLSWQESLTATSYNVKRATLSEGPYEIIASSDTTAYIDTDVIEGENYYYVVSAINEMGESEDSDEVNISPGKIAYLNFDEAESNIAHNAWGDWDGTLQNGVTWTEGLANDGVLLNGNEDAYLTFSEGIMAGVEDFTISTWVKLEENPSWGRIFDFGSGTENFMFLTPRSGNNTVRYAIKNGGGEQRIDGGPALSEGIWHHLAVTFSGNLGILYVDGEEKGRNENMTFSPGDLGITNQNWIGKSQWPDPLLKGRIDEFKIYSKALGEQEIRDMYVALAPPPEAPADLSLSLNGNSLTLTWMESIGATSYVVYKSPDWDGPFTGISEGNDTTFEDGYTEGETYFYKVTALNEFGESVSSNKVSTLFDKYVHLKFDEGEGSVAEDSWSGRDAELESTAKWTEGLAGKAVQLDGNGNSYVTLPQGVMAEIRDFTIATWVKLDANDTWNRVFDFGSGRDKYMFLTPKSAGNTVRYAIKNGGSEQQINASPVLSIGEWHHLAVTQSDNVAILYINGEEAGRNTDMTLSPADLGYSTQNWIGRSQWPDPLMKGIMDEFKIFNRALSGEELREVMKVEQMISLNLGEQANIEEGTIDPQTVATSGLPVGINSSDESVAIIEEGMVHLKGIGSTTITSTQGGNWIFQAAEPVSKVLHVVDLSAPSIPEGLTALRREEGLVELIWQPSTDNVEVAGYEIYRDGVLVSSSLVSENSFITEFPTGNQQYFFSVKAVDTSENISEASEGISVWNGMSGDMPVGEVAILVYPNPSEGDFNVRVSTEATGTVEIYIYDNQGNLVTSSSAFKSSPVYLREFSLPLATKGMYVIKILFNDSEITKSLLLE